MHRDLNIRVDVIGLPGMVLSVISTVVGVIMYYATTAQSSSDVQQHGFRPSTLGVILMVAGVIGFVVSLIVFISSRRAPSVPPRLLDRERVTTARPPIGIERTDCVDSLHPRSLYVLRGT